MYPSAPAYTAWVRSNWSKEENIKMSYSFIAAGGTPEDCEGFQEEDYGNIYFAGEATECDFIGTVHGAFISGDRVANSIIYGEFLKV